MHPLSTPAQQQRSTRRDTASSETSPLRRALSLTESNRLVRIQEDTLAATLFTHSSSVGSDRDTISDSGELSLSDDVSVDDGQPEQTQDHQMVGPILQDAVPSSSVSGHVQLLESAQTAPPSRTEPVLQQRPGQISGWSVSELTPDNFKPDRGTSVSGHVLDNADNASGGTTTGGVHSIRGDNGANQIATSGKNGTNI